MSTKILVKEILNSTPKALLIGLSLIAAAILFQPVAASLLVSWENAPLNGHIGYAIGEELMGMNHGHEIVDAFNDIANGGAQVGKRYPLQYSRRASKAPEFYASYIH
jgi:hypothetical protein